LKENRGIEMFTGLVEEIGIITNIRKIGGGLRISVRGDKVTKDSKIDDSIAINGVCQTVVDINGNVFSVEAVEETLKKTTLNSLRQGSKVNLERAAKLGDRMGGHLVQGHIDCTGKVVSVEKLQTAVNLWVSFPYEFQKYVIAQGSVAIDGISLTVARKSDNMLMVAVIPHTWKVTVLNALYPGDSLNLEFDLIGKYVENMLGNQSNKSSLDKYIDQPDY
jgi:riboflavin synthase